MGMQLTAPELASIEAEVSVWASVLFEPGDIVEVRCLAPKQQADSLGHYRFAAYGTSRLHGIYPWIEARNLATLVRPLAHVNAPEGVPTVWDLQPKAATPDEPARRTVVSPSRRRSSVSRRRSCLCPRWSCAPGTASTATGG